MENKDQAEELTDRVREFVWQTRAEEALRANEIRFRAIVNQTTAAVSEMDLDGNYTLVNEIFCQMLGYTEAELLGKNLRDTTHPDDLPHCLDILAQAIATGKPLADEKRLICKDGSLIWINDSISTIYDSRQQLCSVVAIAVDITRRKQMEEALRNSETRFRTVVDAVPQLIWTNTPEGFANYFNKRWFDYSGLTYEESAGVGWQVMVHPDDAVMSIQRWQQALAEGITFETEYRLRRRDGQYRWHIGRNVPIQEEAGRIVGWFGTATDIDDHKQAANAVREALETVALANEDLEKRVQDRTGELLMQTQSLSERSEQLAQMSQMRQELLRKLVTAQEEERAKISRDLHDETGQQVTALQLGLSALKNTAIFAQDTSAQELLGNLQRLAQDIAQKPHRISFTLRPTALDDTGLMDALQNYAEEWSRWTKVPVHLERIDVDSEGESSISVLSSEIKTTVYRVMQEALTNVMRHALNDAAGKVATHVSLLVLHRQSELVAILEDDGL